MTRNGLWFFRLLMVFTAAAALAAENDEVAPAAGPTRTVLFQPEPPFVLEAGAHLDTTVAFPELAYPTRRFLRVKGAVSMPAPYHERGETNFRRWEYLIDDALDAAHGVEDTTSLHFIGNGEEFERKAYRRIPGDAIAREPLEIHVRAKRNQLRVPEGAAFGVWVELFYPKPGRDKNDVYDAPDDLLFMPIPEGDGPFTEFSQAFPLTEEIAAAVIILGGQGFSGECWVEAPRLSQDAHPLAAIPFEVADQRASDFDYWVGCNLVTRCWPRWQLSFNDVPVFEGNIFDRASNVADFYIPLPEHLRGTGTLRLAHAPAPNNADFPYEVHALELLESPARPFEVVHSPGYLASGAPFGLLVESNVPGLTLSVDTPDSIAPESREVHLAETGLHALRFRALAPDVRPAITLSDGARTESVAVGQIVMKGDDRIALSVGDDIYLDKNGPYFNEYFKWYAGERMGNFYQFRPSYQWSGFREPDLAMLQPFLKLLQDLQMPYAWQVEGRTLAGKEMNPALDVLQSPVFRGKQAHENDGGYYYWQHFLYEGFYSDMAARTRPYGGIFAKHRPIYTDQGVFIHYDPNAVTGMAAGARRFVENLRYSKGESTRHTGPSSLFRYFYQAGYDWLGAEQMYGPEETIMSALRGASRAWHKPDYGSLHAMQWGSFPYTDPKHAHRFFLSLAVAYMHGSSHLNTEDALWTDEYGNDRFSEAGRAHAHVQHQMLDFIQTHTRRGELVTDLAVIQGRNDGWKSFGRTAVWSQNGRKWRFNKACESFDLLKVFYPGNDINACGPEGWFTSTPYGAIDLLPIEADTEALNRYKTLLFLGWNTYDKEDFQRLTAFVKQGGTLVLSAAHLNTALAPDEPPRLPETEEAPLTELLGNGFRERTGKLERTLGDGRVVYFPETRYPVEASLAPKYRQAMIAAAEEANKAQQARGWIGPGEHVGFTVWDDHPRRTIYLLNVDWQHPEAPHTAELSLGTSHFTLEVRPHVLEVVHCAGNIGLMPARNTSDVLEFQKVASGWHAIVQTTEADDVRVFNGATNTVEMQHLADAGIHVLESVTP